MSKRFSLLAAVATLALVSGATAPVFAQEQTVMVGGAAMFPSKNIIQNLSLIHISEPTRPY